MMTSWKLLGILLLCLCAGGELLTGWVQLGWGANGLMGSDGFLRCRRL